jgi:hypothetical protein
MRISFDRICTREENLASSGDPRSKAQIGEKRAALIATTCNETTAFTLFYNNALFLVMLFFSNCSCWCITLMLLSCQTFFLAMAFYILPRSPVAVPMNVGYAFSIGLPALTVLLVSNRLL